MFLLVPLFLVGQDWKTIPKEKLTGDVIVQYRNHKDVEKLLSKKIIAGEETVEPVFTADLFIDGVVPDELASFVVVKNSKKSKIDNIIEQKEADTSVINVYPDEICRTLDIPNDPLFDHQWYLYQGITEHYGTLYDTLYSDLDILRAWKIETGDTNLVIGIVDCWVDSLHNELDDLFFKSKVFRTGATTNETHATTIAGIICAEKDNNYRIAGITDSEYYSLICFSGHPLTSTGTAIARAIVWASNRTPIINCSFTTGNLTIVRVAFEYYVESTSGYVRDGSMAIIAAGNSNTEDWAIPPATWSQEINGFIGVAALDLDDYKSSYSNYGGFIDICGKPDNITVLLPSGLPQDYGFYTSGGTSFAAPQIVGIVALIVSKYPNYFTREDIKYLIKAGAEDIYDKNPTFVGKLGAGKANAFNSLIEAKKLVNKRNSFF